MGEIIKRGTAYPSGAHEFLLLYLWSYVWWLAYYYYLSLCIWPLYFLSFVDLRLLITLLYLQTFLKQYQMYAIPLLCTVLCIILALYKTTNNNTCTFILIAIKSGNETIEQIYTIINMYSGMGAFIYMYYKHMICTMLHLFDDL
jgi:hypothetical protein